MELFSISHLSRFSGIKPHTIRVWEQRYNALQPNRSDGNTRYYDSHQLRRLLNIVSLMNGDYKISELCSLPDKKLFSIINETLQKSIDATDKSEYYISQLIAAGMSYDEPHFEKIFSNCLVRYGMESAYTKVIYPMMARIGLLWSGNSMPPANEHFISNLVRQKIFAAIDAMPPPTSPDKWLLFLPENEFHETGLLFANYLLRLYGKQVIYLGCNVPFDSLLQSVKFNNPAFLLLFLVHNELPELAEKYIKDLNDGFAGRKIYVSGNGELLGQLKLGRKITWLQSVDQLKSLQ